MGGKVIGKNLEGAPQQAGGAVGMAAGAPPGKLATPPHQAFEIPWLRGRRRQAQAGPADRLQAKDAGPALPGALGGNVGHDPGGGIDATRILRQEVDDAAAKIQATRSQRGRLKPQ